MKKPGFSPARPAPAFWWLPRKDSNLVKGNQNPLCYRYTTGQYHVLVAVMVTPQGFEPCQRESKSLVLPLHHGAMIAAEGPITHRGQDARGMGNFFSKMP